MVNVLMMFLYISWVVKNEGTVFVDRKSCEGPGWVQDDLQCLNLCCVCSVQVSHAIESRDLPLLLRCTFSDEVGVRKPSLDLLFVGEVGLGHEGLVQPRAEPVVALGIVTAKK